MSSWTGLRARDEPFEFDGFAPVAMTGGSVNHSQIGQNIVSALRTRLRGSGCRPLGPDAGVATVGDRVRYPDALVTCAKFPGTVRLVPGVVVVFEVLSPGSGRIDRIEKVPEYRAVSSIRRYVIAERDSAALQVLSRKRWRRGLDRYRAAGRRHAGPAGDRDQHSRGRDCMRTWTCQTTQQWNRREAR